MIIQCFLRASGGVSIFVRDENIPGRFSPRKRRCFRRPFQARKRTKVFSAQAEVFPTKLTLTAKAVGFLRASGGVSGFRVTTSITPLFSPRKRRCFPFLHFHFWNLQVFSAQAEVFRRQRERLGINLGFLRASGGVSMKRLSSVELCEFSPRKRRCFRSREPPQKTVSVFSAQAEVFPRTR